MNVYMEVHMIVLAYAHMNVHLKRDVKVHVDVHGNIAVMVYL